MRNKGMTFCTFVLVVGLVVGLTLATPASAKKINWRLQCAYAAADIEYIVLKPFLAKFHERAKGRMEIKTFTGGTIVPEDQQLTACGKGVIEISHASGGYWRGMIPVGDVEFGLPYLYSGDLEKVTNLIYKYKDGAIIKTLREAYAKFGVYHLGVHTVGPTYFLMSTKPIRSIADYKGKKIRISGSYMDMVKLLGASPTWLPGGEIYMALKLGTIDAAGWSAEAIRGYKWYEVAKYLILPTMNDHIFSQFLINTKAWKALPDDLKKIFEDTYHEVYIPTLYGEYMKEWDLVYAEQEKMGLEICRLPDADVAKIKKIAVDTIWKKAAAKDAYSAKVLQLIKDYYGIK